MVYNIGMQIRRGLARMSLAVAALACGACGESSDERQAAAARERTAALANDPELADPLGRALVSQVEEHAPGWVKHERLFRGTLVERGRQSFLAVLPYGHCYRVFGAGSSGVADLDLAMFDSNGVEIARDVTADTAPGLGLGASICPTDAGQYRLEVRARRGHGDYAVGIFRTAE